MFKEMKLFGSQFRSVKTFRLALVWVVFILMVNGSLSGQVVARVGDFEITAGQLSQEVEFISEEGRYKELSYLERREIALEKLIRENLIYIYALENRIEVTEQELEGYFIAQFGDLPRFTTNGRFDMQKFQAVRNTNEIRTILNELRRELMITKTETIIRDNFRFSDQVLLDRYIAENTDIDISYVVIKEEDVNLPFFVNPYEAYRFYDKNRRQYPVPEYYNVEFWIVPFTDYENSVSVSESEISQYFTDLETVPEGLREEVQEEIRRDKIKTVTLEETLKKRHDLINGLHTEIRILQTAVYAGSFAPLNNESPFVRYELIPEIEKKTLNEYSQPVETAYGYLVYRVTGKGNGTEQLHPQIARYVWRDFIRKEVSQEYEEQYKQYYRTNLSELIVPAAHITRLKIDTEYIRSRQRVSDRMLRIYFESNPELFTPEERATGYKGNREKITAKLLAAKLETLIEWCEINIYLTGYDLPPSASKDLANGVNVTNEVIYLELIPHQNEISNAIKDYLQRDINTEVGSFESGKDIVYYRINSFFPAYMPSYEDVEDYLIKKLGIDSQNQDIDYQEYYIKHINLFAAPDSLQLTGLFVPINPDTVLVTEGEVRQYYLSNSESYYSVPEIELEYIFIKDPNIECKDLLSQINDWLLEGVPFSLLQFSFGTGLEIPHNQSFPVSKLPPELYQKVQKLPVGQREGPFYYENGWLMLRKLGEIPSRRISYEKVRDDLYRELQHRIADQAAYDKARQLFIETNSISQIANVEDTLLIFRTEKKSINDVFLPLGSITDYAQRLINLRRNEKLNTLFRNDQGYGIVFLLNKDVNQYYPFEESKPLIFRLISSEQRGLNAQNYIRQLREMIISDADPDSLLIFFGGWKKETNLTLGRIIPQIRYSNLIIDDAMQREVGEVSHLIKISDAEYTFYRVDRKQRVDRDSFQFVRDHYRDYIVDLEFHKWLDQFRSRKVVEKY